jgi:hypothetical protein
MKTSNTQNNWKKREAIVWVENVVPHKSQRNCDLRLWLKTIASNTPPNATGAAGA